MTSVGHMSVRTRDLNYGYHQRFLLSWIHTNTDEFSQTSICSQPKMIETCFKSWHAQLVGNLNLGCLSNFLSARGTYNYSKDNTSIIFDYSEYGGILSAFLKYTNIHLER